GGGPADRVVGGAAEDRHANEGIAQAGGAAGVGADGVPLDQVARRAAEPDVQAPELVVGGRVGGPGGGPADRVVGGAEEDVHTVARVAQAGGAAGVGADEVPLDQIARR